jgi:hypothetical protein
VIAELYLRHEIEAPDLVYAYACALIGKRDFLLKPLGAQLSTEQQKQAAAVAERWIQEHPIQALGEFIWHVSAGE